MYSCTLLWLELRGVLRCLGIVSEGTREKADGMVLFTFEFPVRWGSHRPALSDDEGQSCSRRCGGNLSRRGESGHAVRSAAAAALKQLPVPLPPFPASLPSSHTETDPGSVIHYSHADSTPSSPPPLQTE